MLARIPIAVSVLLFLTSCNRVEEPEAAKSPEAIESPPEQVAEPEERPGEGLFDQANDAAKRRDYETAVRLAEEALATKPRDPDLLLLLARACDSRAFQLSRNDRDTANTLFLKSVESMRNLREVKGALDSEQQKLFANTLYNGACAHALGGEPEKALALLGEAFAEGFPDVGLAETDADFAGLREMPEFKSLIGDARAKLMERLREDARRMLVEHEPFEFSFTLPDTKGDVVSLVDLKGKVVIVDIWGTWCPPCRKEVPHLVALHQEYGDLGLEVVGVNYERGPESEWIGKIESFIADNDVTYRCVIGDRTTRDMVPGFGGFPTTLFVDRNGVVRLKLVGYRPYEQLEAIALELLADVTTDI